MVASTASCRLGWLTGANDWRTIAASKEFCGLKRCASERSVLVAMPASMWPQLAVRDDEHLSAQLADLSTTEFVQLLLWKLWDPFTFSFPLESPAP